MGNRTVSVDLQLKAAGFVAGAKEAEKATSSLNNELDDVAKHGKDFDKAVADADALTVAVKESSHEVDGLGTQMKETGVDARFLADELSKARDKALELAAAFTLTGNKTDLTAYKRQTRYVSDLEKLLAAITPGGGGSSSSTAAVAQTGSKLGRQLGLSAGQDFGEAFGGVLGNPVVWAAAAPAVVEVGAMLGGFLLTGIGVAGIGAGVVGQLHNPQIQAAGAELGTHVAAGFQTATSAFGAPLLDVISTARGEWDHLEVGLHTTFDYLAPEVRALGGGLIGFVDKLAPGLERAAVAAEPLVTDFSNWLPQFGDEFAGLLGTMADNAGTLDDALKLGLGALSLIVDLANYGVSEGSWLFKFAEVTTGTLDWVIGFGDQSTNAADGVKSLDQQVSQLGPDLNALATQMNQTTETTDMLAGAMADKLFDSVMNSAEATLHLAEAQTRLDESLKQNGKSFDIHTKAGQANTEALYADLQANRKVYDSMIAAGASASDAAAAYDKNTAALRDQLLHAGLTKQKVDELIGTYTAIPDTANTTIVADGLVSALNNLGALIAAANHLDGKQFGFTVTEHMKVDGHTYTYSGADQWFHGNAMGGFEPPHYASGGAFFPPTDPGVFMMAEPQTGGEWMIPQRGISQDRAFGLLAGAAAPHGLAVGRPAMSATAAGGGPIQIQLSWAGGDGEIGRAVMNGIRAEVRSFPGGSVQLALGPR